MVPDDAGPVPYQRVMRPLRGERTISVAKCPKQDLNLRWSDFTQLYQNQLMHFCAYAMWVFARGNLDIKGEDFPYYYRSDCH